MQTTPQHLPPLAEFVDLHDLLPLVRHTFPTAESIRWYVRVHREKLAQAGAIIAITGRLRYHPERFQKTAAEIASAAAQAPERGA